MVTVHVDWRIITTAGTVDCFFEATTGTGKTALLRINLKITSSKC